LVFSGILFKLHTLVIDIHSHILAEVDDGPKSWDVAREMCRLAKEDGVECMIATPHANERYHYDREYLIRALAHLRQLVGPEPRLGLGCDFHLSYENIQAALATPSRFTIESTNYLLVELSNFSVPPQISDSLMKLGDKGLIPILTHPERNPILQKSLKRVLEWVEIGVVVQVTASALTGFWGEPVRRSAHWLLEHDAVHVLASDAHDPEHRKPGLSEARGIISEMRGHEVAHALVDGNPRAIVSGKSLPYFPKPLGGK
jgi:protein-tyrosine phosphatase